MTAILLKLFSGVMSIVVFLSGAFPALFNGKQHINPYGNEVYIGDFHAFSEPKIFDNKEALKNIHVNSCHVYGLPEEYESDFFEEKSLVILSVDMSHDDYRIWVKSVAEIGDTLEVEYSVITDGRMHAMLYQHYSSEIIIETSKNIKNVKIIKDEIIVPFNVEWIEQDPLMLFADGTYA